MSGVSLVCCSMLQWCSSMKLQICYPTKQSTTSWEVAKFLPEIAVWCTVLHWRASMKLPNCNLTKKSLTSWKLPNCRPKCCSVLQCVAVMFVNWFVKLSPDKEFDDYLRSCQVVARNGCVLKCFAVCCSDARQWNYQVAKLLPEIAVCCSVAIYCRWVDD